MVNSFEWLVKGVDLPDLDYPRIERWLMAVAGSHGRVCGSLNYMFCDDAEILRVNREFLQHDYYTDIITFDYCRGRQLNGDIVISLDTVRSNAESLGVPYLTELKRVIAHGLLHLCGINDKGPGEREVMEQHEDAALSMFDELSEI